MSAQAAPAMQPAKEPLPVKQAPSDELITRIQKTYDSIAQRAFEMFDKNGRWFGHDLEDIGSVPRLNCCTLFTWKSQKQMRT